MAELEELLDLADLATARSTDVLSASERAETAEAVGRVRHRFGLTGEALVVAMAGPTGSGKSSIINRIVGSDVVRQGIVRPTTSDAVAVVPAGGGASAARILDRIGVRDTVDGSPLPWLILVDLPDFDSIVAAHRHLVERLLPTVDAVVWVVDPEKYADPTVHDEFLARVVAYEPQFIFALNKQDRLADPGPVLDHLTWLLRGIGFVEPDAVATTATRAGGVADLLDLMIDRFDAKATALTKAATDLAAIANRSWRRCDEARTAAPVGSPSSTEAAFAAATFVSLGVAAYSYRDRVGGGSRG